VHGALQGLADGLSALWQGTGARVGPLSDDATLAAAAAGLEHPQVPAPQHEADSAQLHQCRAY
jgi:hypothetical protein